MNFALCMLALKFPLGSLPREYCKIVKLLKFLSAFFPLSLTLSLSVFHSFLCWHVLILYLPFFNKNSHSSPQHKIFKRDGGKGRGCCNCQLTKQQCSFPPTPLPPLFSLLPALAYQCNMLFLSAFVRFSEVSLLSVDNFLMKFHFVSFLALAKSVKLK